MANISKKRICADEAFAAYMALGPSRSLSRLLESYRAQTDIVPPAISTLKLWSTRDAWQVSAQLPFDPPRYRTPSTPVSHYLAPVMVSISASRLSVCQIPLCH